MVVVLVHCHGERKKKKLYLNLEKLRRKKNVKSC